MDRLTPMVKQYLNIKERYPDAILLFRLGDFYEMFNEDARIASSILNIALTSRNDMPMCGVPHHAAEGYIRRLLDAGYKVAICEQVEDPSTAKGIVKREVVRVITPGTYIESEEGSQEDEFITALCREKGDAGAAFASVATGKLFVYQERWEKVLDLVKKTSPKTILIPEGLKTDIEATYREELEDWFFSLKVARETIREHFGSEPEGLGLSELHLATKALGALMHYLKEVLLAPVEHIKRVEIHIPRGKAYLDPSTVRHLELVANLRDGTSRNTLLEVINRTSTPPGYRKLREALLNPLTDKKAIEERLKAVHFLTEQNLKLFLKGIGDVERIVSRIEAKIAKPRELLALKDLLKRIPKIRDALSSDSTPEYLITLKDRLHPMEDLLQLIDRSVEEDDTGYLIKRGYNPELDRLKDMKENSQLWIEEYEGKERERTGIPSLKVRFNKVFGYYIEVTKAHLNKVPPHYIRKQTLVNAERFITEELKRVEEEILTASEKIEELERHLYKEVLDTVASRAEELRDVAHAIGTLDFLNSLAETARERGWTKPEIVETGEIIIKEGRHPVVEETLREGFVPNDTCLEPQDVHIITGPNMSGKSTYIRQVALITLLAQMGSFVPARLARITPVDRIMTRIGTADNLAEGQSTFMVEMTETANILNNATSNSLIILDEVGRGTSTYDGLSIAWATVEYIKKRIRAKTLFATHYHELTGLAQQYPGIKNYRVEVKEWKDRIIFTHRVVPGGADKSYGIYVAQIAGLPIEVIERAKEILAELEAKRSSTSLPLYEHPAILKLRMINLSKVAPMEALMLLEELKRLV